MPIQPVFTNQMPVGAERYGAQEGISQANVMPSYMGLEGVELAPPSGIAFKVDYIHCIEFTNEGNICVAHPFAPTALCIGHLRRLSNQVTPLKKGEKWSKDNIIARAYPHGMPVREEVKSELLYVNAAAN